MLSDFFRLYRRYLGVVWLFKYKYISSWIFLFLLLTVTNLSIFAVGILIDKVSVDGAEIYSILGLITLTLASPIIIEPITFQLKTRIFSGSINKLTSRVYNRVLNLDYDFHANKQTGKLISMIINTPDVMSTYLWNFEWFVLEQFAALLIPLVLMAFIAPEVTAAAVLILILVSPIIMWILRFNVNKRAILKDADYDRNTAIVDGLSNFETVRSFGTELRETSILQDRLDICEKAMNSYQNTFRLLDFVSRSVGVVIFIVGSWIAAKQYESGILTLGSMVVIVSYLIQTSNRLMGMIFSFRDVLKNLPIVEDFFDLLDSDYQIIENEHPIYLRDPSGRIEFENVSFRYEANPELLKGLSLKIESGSSVALVGPSGGGKSTLTRLLMRYYDVNSGSIKIDGTDIRNLAIDNLREIIGIVPQEPILFNRSILYNVGYAINNIQDESEENLGEIVEACKRAHIHDFIENLPNGYFTTVGERGVKLSGGQKQRLAIARVLIKNPKIVIFDEATSMLDSESEKAIQQAFKELSKDKTTIIIAHRLSTIIHSDEILVIDDGKIIQRGTHTALIDQDGVYSKLWSIQSGGFVQA